MTFSNFTICYEGIQRTFRNAIVGQIRAGLNTAYAEDAPAQLRRPFKEEEWALVQRHALGPRASGAIGTTLTDDFDLLSVNHFFNLFECHYDVLCPTGSVLDKSERSNERKKLLEWLRNVKELRDPTSHPPEADLTYEDGFVLLDCARRSLLRLGMTSGAERIHQLMGQLSGRPLTQEEPLEANLPPQEAIVVHFVGRDAELSALWDWLCNPVAKRWALSGAGGKGKTAIAYQFALDVRKKAPEPLQAVLWLSAKKRRFDDGTVKPIPTPDFNDLSSALTQLLLQYGWIEDTEQSVDVKRVRALELLDKFPALVVVDDIDSVEQDGEDVIEFFSLTAPQTKSKVLFTSRRVIWGMGSTTTQVAGFSDYDATRFIHSRCRLLDTDLTIFTRQVIKRIVEVTEGSPLYIEDLMRFTSVLPVSESIQTWASRGGQEARLYALGREMDMLTNDARFVLVAACVREGPVSFVELQSVTGLKQEVLTDSLRQLQGLFLVPKPRLIEGESRFEINFNVRSLVRETQAKSDLFSRAVAAYKAITGELPRVRRSDIASIIRQVVFMVRSGEEQEAAQLLCRALEKYQNDVDLIGVLGWVYRKFHPPRYTDARSYFQRGHELNNRNEEMYRHWARMEMDLHDWTKAAEAAEKGIRKCPNSKELCFLAGYARSRLGQEMESRLQTISAQSELERSLPYLEKARDIPDSGSSQERDLNRQIYRAIVITCARLQDSKKLLEAFDAWFKEHPDDPNTQSEWDRLAPRFGLTNLKLI
ncbi:MAG: tetratricopeptide repeat protein [Bryobacteraceae bacterium]